MRHVMPRLAGFLALACACAGPHAAAGGPSAWLKGPLDELEIVRRAVRDSMWNVAEKGAQKAARDKGQAFEAHRAELEAAARKGDWARVRSAADAWDAAEPHPCYRYWRAYARVQQGDLAEADRILDAGPFTDAVYAMLVFRLRARVAALSGDPAQADAIYRRAAERVTDPAERVSIGLEYARFLVEHGKREEALTHLRKNGALDFTGAIGDEARLFAAETLAALPARAAEAEKILERVMAGGTNTEARLFAEAACLSADLLWARGATNLALSAGTAAVARAESPVLRRKAGLRLGMHECSVPATQAAGAARIAALVRDFPEAPETRRAQRWLADAALARGDFAAAIEAYRLYLELDPAAALDATVYEAQGRALVGAGRLSDAVAAFAGAAQKAETNRTLRARCLFQQAETLARDGRWKAAAEIYARAHTADPSGERARAALFQEADAFDRAEEPAAADGVYARLAETQDALGTEAALRLAARESKAGRSLDALARYDRLVADTNLAPRVRLQALMGRGRARYRAFQFDLAAEDFAAALPLAPDQADRLRFLSALCLYGSRRDDEAVTRVRRLAGTTKDAPLRADIGLWLAKLEYNRGDWLAAETGFCNYAGERAADARSAEALLWAARSAYMRNAFTNATALAARAIDAAPRTATALAARLLQAESLIQVARYDEAVLLLDEVLQTKNAEVAAVQRAEMLRADALFARGADSVNRYAEAIEAYRAILSNGAVPPAVRIEAAFKAARALEKIGGAENQEEAERLWYVDVVQAFVELRRQDAWVDDATVLFFTRGAFALADARVARGDLRAAGQVLLLVEKAGVPAAADARKRRRELREKGNVK